MFRQVFSFCAGLLASYSGTNAPQLTPETYLALSPTSLTAVSKSSTGKDPSRVWALPNGGVAYNGTAYRDFSMRVLPVTGVPVFTSNGREGKRPAARLVFVPGFGSSLSHTGSLLGTMRAFREIALGSSASSLLGKWVAENHSELSFEIETVAFDLPGAGWAPPLDDFSSAFDLSRFIYHVVNELSSDGLPTFIVARSGSCPLAAVALSQGMRANGLVMTSATYPDPVVMAENRAAIQEAAERQEYSANWEVVNGVIGRLLDPRFVREINALKPRFSKAALLAISGGRDGQTSLRARAHWTRLLGAYPRRSGSQSTSGHLVIPEADHFVFSGPKDRARVSADDPDVKAFVATLRYIAARFSP